MYSWLKMQALRARGKSKYIEGWYRIKFLNEPILNKFKFIY